MLRELERAKLELGEVKVGGMGETGAIDSYDSRAGMGWCGIGVE